MFGTAASMVYRTRKQLRGWGRACDFTKLMTLRALHYTNQITHKELTTRVEEFQKINLYGYNEMLHSVNGVLKLSGAEGRVNEVVDAYTGAAAVLTDAAINGIKAIHLDTTTAKCMYDTEANFRLSDMLLPYEHMIIKAAPGCFKGLLTPTARGLYIINGAVIDAGANIEWILISQYFITEDTPILLMVPLSDYGMRHGFTPMRKCGHPNPGKALPKHSYDTPAILSIATPVLSGGDGVKNIHTLVKPTWVYSKSNALVETALATDPENSGFERIVLNLLMLYSTMPITTKPTRPKILSDDIVEDKEGELIEPYIPREVELIQKLTITKQFSEEVSEREIVIRASGGEISWRKPHWRRAHYRRQKVGKGREDVRVVRVRSSFVGSNKVRRTGRANSACIS